MADCYYKDKSDGMCCRSTCEHHCKIVTDEICSKCVWMQDGPFISKEQQLKKVIREALDKMVILPENAEVITILRKGLKI